MSWMRPQQERLQRLCERADEYRSPKCIHAVDYADNDKKKKLVEVDGVPVRFLSAIYRGGSHFGMRYTLRRALASDLELGCPDGTSTSKQASRSITINPVLRLRHVPHHHPESCPFSTTFILNLSANIHGLCFC